jgi:hypothetical protein
MVGRESGFALSSGGLAARSEGVQLSLTEWTLNLPRGGPPLSATDSFLFFIPQFALYLAVQNLEPLARPRTHQ